MNWFDRKTMYERKLSNYGLMIKIYHPTVHKIIEKFIDTDGNLEPSQPRNVRSVWTDDMITHIKYTKSAKPSTYGIKI